MIKDVSNELILEHLQALKQQVQCARSEKNEIRELLITIKSNVETLKQGTTNLDTHLDHLMACVRRLEQRLKLLETQD
ncbi:MAG: hypothetical protein AAF665_13900 [Pseudomonadota bacterium]